MVIDPFTTIHNNVIIGEGTWIGSNVTIMEGARIGKNCKIFPGTVISAIPQDLKFANEHTITEIGDNTVIRECVTIHRGTVDKMKTSVGKNCLLMGYVHIAHDCIVGDNCVFAARSGITNDIAANSFCAGFPARPHKEWLKLEAYKSKLPDLNAKVKKLEKRLAELEKKS